MPQQRVHERVPQVPARIREPALRAAPSTQEASTTCPGWPLLEQRPERDGIRVVPVFRGGVEVRECLAQEPAAEVTMVAGSIGPQAMADDGWLRWLLRHADSSGRARLVLDRLPNPDTDDERIVALRLRLAMEMGKMSVYAARHARQRRSHGVSRRARSIPRTCTSPKSRSKRTRSGRAGWVVPVASSERREPTLLERRELGSRHREARAPGKLSDLEPNEATPAIVVHTIPRLATGTQATFRHWLKNASGEQLNARPLRTLKIVDPYLHTEWQISLLEDLVKPFREGGCARVQVETYAPASEKAGTGYGTLRTLSAAEQQTRIAIASGDATWRSLPLPTDSLLRQHQRFIEGSREDGSRFLVLLERGLDFIAFDRRRGVRATRESYLVVKEE